MRGSLQNLQVFFPLRESFTVVLIGGKKERGWALSEHTDEVMAKKEKIVKLVISFHVFG